MQNDMREVVCGIESVLSTVISSPVISSPVFYGVKFDKLSQPTVRPS